MVFTGIIEEIGTVRSLEEVAGLTMWDGSVSPGTVLTIHAPQVTLQGAYIGCSIAVNGTCLTVTSFDAAADVSVFSVGLAPETLRRTNLIDLKPGDPVNLERAQGVFLSVWEYVYLSVCYCVSSCTSTTSSDRLYLHQFYLIQLAHCARL